MSTEHKRKLSEIGRLRKLTDAEKQKISKANKGNKACAGKIFINNGQTVKRVNSDKLAEFLKAGWKRGRGNFYKQNKTNCKK